MNNTKFTIKVYRNYKEYKYLNSKTTTDDQNVVKMELKKGGAEYQHLTTHFEIKGTKSN